MGVARVNEAGFELAELKWWTGVCPLFQEVDRLDEAIRCFGYDPDEVCEAWLVSQFPAIPTHRQFIA